MDSLVIYKGSKDITDDIVLEEVDGVTVEQVTEALGVYAEDVVVKDEIHTDLRALVEELPDKQKEVLIMRHYCDMSFKDIAEEFRRDPDHLLKYLSGEMATLANFDGTRAVFQGRFSYDSIKNIIESYAKKYVVCPVCKRPDTRIIREKRLWFLQCEACGAKSSIGAK